MKAKNNKQVNEIWWFYLINLEWLTTKQISKTKYLQVIIAFLTIYTTLYNYCEVMSAALFTKQDKRDNGKVVWFYPTNLSTDKIFYLMQQVTVLSK